MKALVIIPTYNESDNIAKIIDAVLFQDDRVSVLVVDDNSPDGTADIVKGIRDGNSRVDLIVREGKMGLGTAYVAGFKYAIEKKYDYVFEMDADFSHAPTEISNFLHEIQSSDLVLGSRYIKGVNVVNWPLRRLILSYGANIYTRIITNLPVKDGTGGYKCFRREVLESIDLDKVHSNGYAFQIEMTYKAWKKGFSIKEIPIVFIDRAEGSSKMSKKIVREAVWMVWKLRFLNLIGKL
ncbi:polyprenol monophosphomannose synthase [candidate division KSB1 bacterium]